VKLHQVFISYAKEDRDVARRLREALNEAGVNVWIDSVNLSPGCDWNLSIREAIHSSRYFLAVLSPNSVSKRGYVQRELKTAIDLLDEMPPDEVFIIPVRTQPCEPRYEVLGKLHWLDLYPSFDDAIERLLAVVNERGILEADIADKSDYPFEPRAPEMLDSWL